ncbi:(2Fe-2S)-binding protein [Bermanella sp. R86510]|uniref:(2Fe-2S)-binding protein n=1 Tax=unclassified Bermanella TaxID=2627862 RepID=UPI0037CB62AA
MYVCVCKGITDRQIQQALEDGADYREIRSQLGVASDCGQCGNLCKQMVREHMDQSLFYEVSAA